MRDTGIEVHFGVAAEQMRVLSARADDGLRVGSGRYSCRERIARSPDLGDFAGRVSDSGEGRWTVEAAVETGVPAAVITAALYERFESRGNGDYTDKILSAMRSEFGGHAEQKE